MNGSAAFMYLLSACFVGTVMVGGAVAAETNLKTTASRYSVIETIERIENCAALKEWQAKPLSAWISASAK